MGVQMKLGLILGAVSLFAASLFGAEDCAKFVDIKIGTAGTGHTYPGLSRRSAWFSQAPKRLFHMALLFGLPQ